MVRGHSRRMRWLSPGQVAETKSGKSQHQRDARVYRQPMSGVGKMAERQIGGILPLRRTNSANLAAAARRSTPRRDRRRCPYAQLISAEENAGKEPAAPGNARI